MPITYVPKEDPVRRWGPWTGGTGGQLIKIPTTREELVFLYGDPVLYVDGQPTERASVVWEKKNLVERYGAKAIPGIPPQFYFQTHRLVEPYWVEGLRRAAIVCPWYKIRRAASYNFRRIRHDTPAKAKAEKRPLRKLSIHAYGAAGDIDAKENQAVTFKKKEDVPDFFSPAWLKIWPQGLPQEFVDAMISVGFVWGGDFNRNEIADDLFCDPMHFQLATCG